MIGTGLATVKPCARSCPRLDDRPLLADDALSLPDDSIPQIVSAKAVENSVQFLTERNRGYEIANQKSVCPRPAAILQVTDLKQFNGG